MFGTFRLRVYACGVSGVTQRGMLTPSSMHCVSNLPGNFMSRRAWDGRVWFRLNEEFRDMSKLARLVRSFCAAFSTAQVTRLSHATTGIAMEISPNIPR